MPFFILTGQVLYQLTKSNIVNVYHF